MAVYDLSGNGVQALTSGTSRLFVQITSLPPSYSTGRANPVNYFDVGLIRLGEGAAFYRPVALDGDQIIIDCPPGSDKFGYALFATTTATVSEDTPVIVGWTTVATGTLTLGTGTDGTQSDPITLPGGYNYIRLVASGSGAGGVFVKAADWNDQSNEFIPETTPPCDVTYAGTISGNQIVVDFYGYGPGSLNWTVYVAATLP